MIRIKLSRAEVEHIKNFLKKGHKSARALTRARILLLSFQGERCERVSKLLNIDRSTVTNIKRRYAEEGLESALAEKSRSGQPKRYTRKHEAEIIATACTTPPVGRKRWSLVLLAEELKRKKGFETINRETIRLVLKKAKPGPG